LYSQACERFVEFGPGVAFLSYATSDPIFPYGRSNKKIPTGLSCWIQVAATSPSGSNFRTFNSRDSVTETIIIFEDRRCRRRYCCLLKLKSFSP